MQLREVFSKKRMVAIVGVAALSLGMAVPALADPVTEGGGDTQLTVEGGDLKFTVVPAVGDMNGGNPIDLVDIIREDVTETRATVSDFEVLDATGSGLGWKVQVVATQFAQVDAAGEPVEQGRELPGNALKLTEPDVAPLGASSGANVGTVNATDGLYHLIAGETMSIASAAVDAGMGQYEFTGDGEDNIEFVLELDPATTFAVMYQSTVTITLSSGPSGA